MSIEFQMLAWSMVLALVLLLLAVLASISQRGIPWALGPRDGTPALLTGLAGRLDRGFRNMMETFPLFAAAVLAVAATGHTSANTALGAQLYFWGRVAYVPGYLAGIPAVRTVIWGVSMGGIVLVLTGLF
jgi:uncharacterized MAPEG superfamily protein